MNRPFSANNGVNLSALRGARNALADAPDGARFVWRAESAWAGGTRARSRVGSFHGFGRDHRHRTDFVLETDQPGLFDADDLGPTPAECVLAALAGCLTAGIACAASVRNVQLRAVSIAVEGGMDVRGTFGVAGGGRAGFDGIHVRCVVDADANAETIEKVVASAQRHSPVFDMLSTGTPVRVDVVTSDEATIRRAS